MKIFLINLLLLSCSLSQKSLETSKASETPPIEKGLDPNINVKKFVLDNGLKLLVIENNRLPIFSYYTLYDVGGRHEEEGTTGATHFLEHMMFKGSKKYGPQVFDDNIEKSGGRNNAYTTFDSTVYYESLPKETLRMVVDMEADRMENLLLIPSSVEQERNVIFEERKMRYENSPQGKLYQSMMKAVFDHTPYGGSVIGDVKDLKRLTPKILMSFYKRFYRPNNTVIVVAGDVKADHLHKLIQEKMGHFKASKELVDYKNTKDNPNLFRHQGNYKRDIKLKGPNPMPLFTMAFKGVPLGTQKGFVLDLLSSILGDTESSYFSQKFVKGRNPIMISVNVANYTLKHNGIFFIMGQLANNISPQKAKRIILKELKNVCQKAVTARNVEKTKNQYLVKHFKEIQTNPGVAHFIGNRELFFGDFNFYKRELEAYRMTTSAEVKRECEILFNNQEYIYVSIWNKYKG